MDPKKRRISIRECMDDIIYLIKFIIIITENLVWLKDLIRFYLMSEGVEPNQSGQLA